MKALRRWVAAALAGGVIAGFVAYSSNEAPPQTDPCGGPSLPNAGWKGRALYANYGTHFVWHIEGGKGTKGKIVKFQMRPDPLAR